MSLLNTSFFRNHRIRSDFVWMIQDEAFWKVFAEAYDCWLNSRHLPEAKEIRIPKIIHQIWIGGNLPRKYLYWTQQWQKLHPDFTYKLWNNDDILQLGLANEKQYLSTNNPGIKSDLARYEILYRYGGIYVDTDCQPLKPIHISDFTTIGQHNCIMGMMSEYKPLINNATIIAEKNSSFLEQLIRNIPDSIDHNLSPIEVLAFCGADYITANIKINPHLVDQILVFPSQYFYAWPNFERDSLLPPSYYATSQSLSIHHWHVSWAKRSILYRIYSKLKKALLRIK